MKPAALVPRVALSPAEAAESLGVARSTLYELLRSGQIRGRKLGTRTLIATAELERFLLTLPEVEADRLANGAA